MKPLAPSARLSKYVPMIQGHLEQLIVGQRKSNIGIILSKMAFFEDALIVQARFREEKLDLLEIRSKHI